MHNLLCRVCLPPYLILQLPTFFFPFHPLPFSRFLPLLLCPPLSIHPARQKMLRFFSSLPHAALGNARWKRGRATLLFCRLAREIVGVETIGQKQPARGAMARVRVHSAAESGRGDIRGLPPVIVFNQELLDRF